MPRVSREVGLVSTATRGLIALALTLVAAVAAPARASAEPVPPGGRANYVVALMRNIGTESFVRLAEYSLRADGTARADYWAWNAQTLKGRMPSGFTTSGCALSCTVWTPDGFQNAPGQLYGTWTVAGNDLSITWTSGSSGTERWRFSNLATTTKLDLASHQTATDGFGWGSTVGFRTGIPMSTIRAAHGTYEGPTIENNYGTITERVVSQTIHRDDANYPNRLCNANCINISTNTNKYYMAGSGTDRKMFLNHQLYDVNSRPCIGEGHATAAGHMKPALQIIDDAGAFRGWVTVEASLYSFQYGGNILGIADMNDI
ncbi:hypothetical protein [Plantactinospora sp. DSM 117369]